MRSSQEAKARQAQKMLAESSRAGNSHVLVIEEAHDLSIQTLKVLKRFWELEDGFKRLLAIILIGQPELKLRLDQMRLLVKEVTRFVEDLMSLLQTRTTGHRRWSRIIPDDLIVVAYSAGPAAAADATGVRCW